MLPNSRLIKHLVLIYLRNIALRIAIRLLMAVLIRINKNKGPLARRGASEGQSTNKGKRRLFGRRH
jgi:hypothetical protein